MNPLKVFILDDEVHSRNNLRRALLALPGVEIVGEAGNLEDAAQLIPALRPNLAFFDIRIETSPEKESFHLIERLVETGQMDFQVVFITGNGSEEYALRAFRLSALHYLHKNGPPEEIAAALEKARERIAMQTPVLEMMKNVLDIIRSLLQQRPPQSLFINLGQGTIKQVEVNAISHLVADGNYTHFHLLDGTRLMTMENLGFYKDELCRDQAFIQIHRSIVINFNAIDTIERKDGLTMVLLKNGKHCPVSEGGEQKLRDALRQKAPLRYFTEMGLGRFLGPLLRGKK